MADDSVERVIHMRTHAPRARTSCWSPPRSPCAPTTARPRWPAAIDAAEARIREAEPVARVIYLEPDIERDAAARGRHRVDMTCGDDRG